MGKYTLYGILIIVGVFLLLFGVICTTIDVTNPLTGVETNIWGLIWGWLTSP